MKTVLISGGSGFIGTSFINKYSDRYKLIVILKNSKKNHLWGKKNKHKNIKIIYFLKYENIVQKIRKLNIEIFINLATLYLKDYDFKKINNLIESNILFPSIITNSLNAKKIKKIINFGTMMQHYNNKGYNPQNFYSATKESFLKINDFFKNIFLKTKFYNLKLHDTYGENDKRIKIIPMIIKSYKNNSIFKLSSKKLSLNILHVDDVTNAIYLIIEKNITGSDYMIYSKNFSNIGSMIERFNKNSIKKIKYIITNKKLPNRIKFKVKKLPLWKQKRFIEKDFAKIINA
mgnify:CR=1 FL=1|tara:strand:+ start:239 stop:1105 length:867 start_codon:yes stop_codon:yes gene_type:complete